MKSTEEKIVEFRQYLIKEIEFAYGALNNYKPTMSEANFFAGKYRALNETLIELDANFNLGKYRLSTMKG
jgi:hypothetical protein